MTEWAQQSQVACVVGTRPGDYGEVGVTTLGGEGEGWPGWAMALSPLEPARQRGLAAGGEGSVEVDEPGGVRCWHATWRLRGVEDCDLEPGGPRGRGRGTGTEG